MPLRGPVMPEEYPLPPYEGFNFAYFYLKYYQTHYMFFSLP